MTKDQLRSEIKAVLTNVEKLEYEQRCFQIMKNLYALPEWRQAGTIGVTISTPFEIDTWQLIRFSWLNGKTICVPKCFPETREMQFFELNNFADLEKVYAGLYEPKIKAEKMISQEKIDLLIVPGLLFNRSGYRLGFGGGYYDRFLTTYSGQAISLAFSFQLNEEIPVEPHDFPVQKIITDQAVISC